MPDERKTDRNSERQGGGDRPIRFGCCGTGTVDAVAGCPCHSIVKRHPVAMSAILAFMGLALLVIPAGAILGIIAFLRTI